MNMTSTNYNMDDSWEQLTVRRNLVENYNLEYFGVDWKVDFEMDSC